MHRIAGISRPPGNTRSAAVITLLIACAAGHGPAAADDQGAATGLDDFCLQAQALLANTRHPFEIKHYRDIEGFGRSKAMIDPPTVKQYIWYEDDTGKRPAMVSCKMKSADHLNLRYPEADAGPDGLCQDMNRQTLARVQADIGSKLPFAVKFDPDEVVMRAEAPFSAGPAWLSPFAQATRDADGALVIHSKGFRVDFSDPRFVDRPEPFRGIQYCHFIAPAYLQRLLAGEVSPGMTFGIDVTPHEASD